jgi:heterodisulfide reductase subunit B
MKYFYYPGCTLEGTAAEYDASTRAVMERLGVELIELEDWTCCGASAADSVGRLLSLVLPARNLAIAQKTGIEADFLIPCSACYLNLRRVDDFAGRDDSTLDKINQALSVEGLTYSGGLRARHFLDVISQDIGAAEIASQVRRRLSGLRVVPYYGCQALRPYGDYDDPERPQSMEPIIEALGCSVFPWSMGAKCCGAGLMTTKKKVAVELVGSLLEEARGADCIVTVCPMCQMNLDSCQKTVSRARGKDLGISVLYLPQLIGLAFDLPEQTLKINLNLHLSESLKTRLRTRSPDHSASQSASR